MYTYMYSFVVNPFHTVFIFSHILNITQFQKLILCVISLFLLVIDMDITIVVNNLEQKQVSKQVSMENLINYIQGV